MKGKNQQADNPTRSGTPSVGTATTEKDRDKQGRVGKYGGDDGALEHDNAEVTAPTETRSTPQPGRKQDE